MFRGSLARLSQLARPRPLVRVAATTAAMFSPLCTSVQSDSDQHSCLGNGLQCPDPSIRAAKHRRYCFTVEVKADKLALYKKYHDQIFPEVAGGLRVAGVKQLTIFQLPGTNRLVMYIETDGNIDLAAATGPGSTYQSSSPRCQEWEELMCSFFEGGDWTQMSEIHSSDDEWNASLGLAKNP